MHAWGGGGDSRDATLDGFVAQVADIAARHVISIVTSG
jgi:hypothetical protein